MGRCRDEWCDWMGEETAGQERRLRSDAESNVVTSTGPRRRMRSTQSLETIAEALAKEEAVRFAGLGTFRTKSRAAGPDGT